MSRQQILSLGVAVTLAISGSSLARANGHMMEPFEISQIQLNQVPAKFRRQEVRYFTSERPGTIIVDTSNRFLYLVIASDTAVRYGIGVGRQGFSWAGTAVIGRKARWPRWTPPAEMVARDAEAAKWADGMPGGPTNPLGARALYLFQGNVDTLYRIHGTFQVASIGKAVSSGCIRLLNADIADLYERVPLGTTVVVGGSRSNVVASKEANGEVAKEVRKEPSPKRKHTPVVRRNFNLDL
jgi:lipoprotein-anchoring transpeptidase ErfK/SrfK